jgi:hypothetical protein
MVSLCFSLELTEYLRPLLATATFDAVGLLREEESQPIYAVGLLAVLLWVTHNADPP